MRAALSETMSVIATAATDGTLQASFLFFFIFILKHKAELSLVSI